MAEIKPTYLIAGATRQRSAAPGSACGPARSETAAPGRLSCSRRGTRRAPDAEALIGSLAAISLTASHRYLLADGVEGWGKKDTETVAEALAAIPPDTTVVLVAHGKPRRH